VTGHALRHVDTSAVCQVVRNAGRAEGMAANCGCDAGVRGAAFQRSPQAARAEADVVSQNEKNIGAPLGAVTGLVKSGVDSFAVH
jgi:hypothetical protein